MKRYFALPLLSLIITMFCSLSWSADTAFQLGMGLSSDTAGFSNRPSGFCQYQNRSGLSGMYNSGLSAAVAGNRLNMQLPDDLDDEGDGGGLIGSVNVMTLHRYLGYTTIVAALATAATNSSRSLHCDLAKVTVGLAGVTVLSGIYQYGLPALKGSDFFEKKNVHKAMAALGMLSCAASVYMAENNGFSSHPGFGVTGGILMTSAMLLLHFDVPGLE